MSQGETEGLLAFLDPYINAELLQWYSVLSQSSPQAYGYLLYWWRNQHKGKAGGSEGEEEGTLEGSSGDGFIA